MINIEDCWGEKLTKTLIKPNTDYAIVEGECTPDEIIFILEKSKIRVLPVTDTDEIHVEISKNDPENQRDLSIAVPILNDYNGLSLSMAWNGANSNGYFDLYVLGFDQLHPTVMMLSEGNVLKLFTVTGLKIPATKRTD